ncbi:MAG: N-acetyltransferase [Nitrospiraceae bacterium]|nr:N-acetyltransferase [Nitrospiraceae bacterium]|tara:strand:- start:768 stop:1904 length:1137 start_codon:yes stop_codon:yes gene_type:complete
MDSMEQIRVIPVTNRRLRRDFIRLPWLIYSNDPIWIPPLFLERQEQLSQRNPYFAHARAKFWLAYQNETAVGRISAQIDKLHLERYQDLTGFFGMIEAEDNAEVFKTLFTTAETWLRSQGMRYIRGPFNLSINQECGLLVDGFEYPPMVMMGHAPRYYSPQLESLGYRKVKDTLAYRIDATFTPPPVMQLIAARTAERITVRPLQRSNFKRDISILQDIFNDAWADNWGYIPFTETEFSHLARSLKYLVADDLIQIAEVDGIPAAMIVVFPNVNEAIRDLNGRLFPFGWIKLLWRLKATHPKTARIPLMGVRKRYQRSLLGTALAFMVIDAVRNPGLKRSIQEVELSWILEDNHGMRNILHSLGGTPYKQYRIYQKEL